MRIVVKYHQIHYSYIGSNESCQKSEKDLTFLVPRNDRDNDNAATKVASDIEAFIDSAVNAGGRAAAAAEIDAQIANKDSALNEAYGS